MSEKNPNPRNKPLQGGGQYKVLSIWIAVSVIIASLLLLFNREVHPPKELSMPALIALATQENTPIKPNAVLQSQPQNGPKWHVAYGKMAGPDGKEISFRAKGQLTDDGFEKLQSTLLFTEREAGNRLLDVFLTFAPIVLIIVVIYFLFLRQIKNAGRGAMSFGKSRARMLTRDREKVTFKDVAGCDEAKEEIAEVVEFLKDPKKFQKVGGRIPKGILLVGPPGTGKTLVARAVAGEADVPFFSISGSDFVEMFVGVGAARVRDMFEQGRKSAPCIIFIDEIDAVGRQRGAGLGGGNDEREQTLNSLLVEMDGFDAHEGVIIIAATNRPDVLDSALMRPGRFDRQIVIDLPDLKGREEILAVHAKKVKLAADVDLTVVARNTPGFSGADLANLLNESALLAARYNKKEVDRHDIEEARDKIAYGRERRKLMDDEDKRLTAYHEAGHALVQALLEDKKLKLHKVTIIPRGRALGMTMFSPTKDILGQNKQELLNRICMAMGGRIGEEVETKDISNGAASDIKQATNIARHMVCDWGMSNLGPIAYGDNQEHIFLAREITRTQNFSEDTARRIDLEISEIVRTQFERAKEIIEGHVAALHKIAELLLEHETIEGVHVMEVLKHGDIKTPIVSLKRTTLPTEPPPLPGEKKATPKEEKDNGISPGAEPALA